MPYVSRELVRIARERVILWERELDECATDDTVRRLNAVDRLNEAKVILAGRLDMYNRESDGTGD